MHGSDAPETAAQELAYFCGTQTLHIDCVTMAPACMFMRIQLIAEKKKTATSTHQFCDLAHTP
jgi:hypothetical protein